MKRWISVILLAILVVAPAPKAEGAVAPGVVQQRLMVGAGDEKDLWLIVAAKSKVDQPEDESEARSMVVLHRRVNDPAEQLQRVIRLRGRVLPGGAAASEQRLWLVYEDMSLQSMGLAGASTRVISPYSKPRAEPRLVQGNLGTQLRSLGANRMGPWALVKVGQAEALRLIDQRPVDDDDGDGDGDDDDEGPRDQGAKGPSAKENADASENLTPGPPGPPGSPGPPEPLPPVRLPQDRLLKLERGRWSTVDLPTDWPADSRGWMVFDRLDAPRPRLISEISQGMFAVYQHRDQQWQRQDYVVDAVAQADVMPLSIEGQLVMAVLQNPSGARPKDLSVALSVLRDGKVIKLGVLMIKDAPTRVWAVAPAGKAAALLVMDKPVRGRLASAVWTMMDLRGRGEASPSPLKIETYSPYRSNTGHVLVVAVLSISMLLMITFTRKKPLETAAKLPATLQIADLSRRVIAAMIDLAPCAAATMLLFDEVRDNPNLLWPGTSDTWQDMLPGLAMIGMNIAHTMATELFTGRSIGKMMLGLKVVTMDGQPPNVWQIVGRNLLRSLDLIAWYALPILMVLSPNHQRLGDVIAQTVVVATRDEDESDS